MNAELEALVLSRDALLEGMQGPDAKRLNAEYHSRLDAVLERNPGLTREKLREIVARAHVRWLHAQKKFPTVPPKA